MIKKLSLLLLLGCRSSGSTFPAEPTYPGMCEDYYQLKVREQDDLSQEAKEWCEELCLSNPVQDRYECATMYCCLQIRDCREGYWDKAEYKGCLQRFGVEPYQLER